MDITYNCIKDIDYPFADQNRWMILHVGTDKLSPVTSKASTALVYINAIEGFQQKNYI